ncbi:MAG: hypothetical protein HY906_17975 [Deltaproteobacteria bacterium]|nr:hypothetical protein [Deltaproteobacteria bacterium]
MIKWIVAGMTIVTLSLGGAALATKEMGKAVGKTGCANCHEGKPADKNLKAPMKKHFEDCKSKGKTDCQGCHGGQTKGKNAC